MITTFFFSYILSYFGFLLGKATDEEHEEIKNYVNYFIDLLTFITYVIMFYYFFREAYVMFLFILLLAFRIYYKRNNLMIIIHNLILYSFTFTFLNKFQFEAVYIALIPLLIIIFNKSFDKFHLKKEIYYLFLVFTIHLVFSI